MSEEVKELGKVVEPGRTADLWYGERPLGRGFIRLVQGNEFEVRVTSRLPEESLIPPNGTELGLVVYTERARYVFKARLLERQPQSGSIWRFVGVSNLKRVQLRDYVRARVHLHVWYAVLKDEADMGRPIGVTHRGTAVDLSGGGMNLVVKENIPVGSALWLRFNLPGLQVETMGRVRRSQKLGLSAGFSLGIEFEGLLERVRDRIIGYTFQRIIEEQRRRIQLSEE